MMKHSRFAAMVATSTVVMFGLMYLNTYALDHAYFSETRAYMALVMGATMAVVITRLHVVDVHRPAAEPRDPGRQCSHFRGVAVAGTKPGDGR